MVLCGPYRSWAHGMVESLSVGTAYPVRRVESKFKISRNPWRI